MRGTASPDGKPKSRPLTVADLPGIAEVTGKVIQQAVDREVAMRLVPLTKEVAALREQLAELDWQLGAFRERAGLPPIKRTYEKIVGASYDASGKIIGMTKEIMEDSA
jgi:hypothetical protein